MGGGNFGALTSSLTTYVMKTYNEAKYLEPSIPFQSFIRHISIQLPREVQTNLMTKKVADLNELEDI